MGEDILFSLLFLVLLSLTLLLLLGAWTSFSGCLGHQMRGAAGRDAR